MRTSTTTSAGSTPASTSSGAPAAASGRRRPVTTDFNFVDLVWHECEFREGDSFSYVLRDADGGYLGCAYLYPLGRRSELTESLARHDVDVSWWVTADAYEAGYYQRAYDGLQRWVIEDFPFTNPYWSNRELPG